MVHDRRTICLLLLSVVLVGCASAPLNDRARAGPTWRSGPPGWSIPQQIPNLLREILDAVQKAVEDLEDSLREQLCGRCPVSVGGVLLAVLWALGHDWMRRS
jgi:hypothetical protein